MRDLIFGTKIAAVMFLVWLALMLVLAWINNAHAYTYCAQSRYASSCWSTPDEGGSGYAYVPHSAAAGPMIGPGPGPGFYVPPTRMRPPYETEQ